MLCTKHSATQQRKNHALKRSDARCAREKLILKKSLQSEIALQQDALSTNKKKRFKIINFFISSC